ncbi:TetR family transcriptional regulator [Candidatus Protofrankia californiensis]|uniref:TetR family transcriptional regulator n=1 Tax=Candidatus Protofrankia californiensis TaxID=1839754 RepID=UPI001F4999E2|nr:TetR family transcriptional regulator [Candidatus Protofrankia californiensis]
MSKEGGTAMARPKVPLISKRRALEVALEIINAEGIESLSIRRLAERLKVNGASLYHHFQNKDEIVVGAAQLALEGVRAPQTHDEPWRVWILRNARRLRQAFREYPDLVPVMLRRRPLSIGSMELETTAALLAKEGVPVGAIVPMLEALELAAIGSALHEARGDGGIDPDHDAERTPHLIRAFERRALSADEIFDKLCGQIIDTVVATAAERAASQEPEVPAARMLSPRQPQAGRTSPAKATA